MCIYQNGDKKLKKKIELESNIHFCTEFKALFVGFYLFEIGSEIKE